MHQNEKDKAGFVYHVNYRHANVCLLLHLVLFTNVNLRIENKILNLEISLPVLNGPWHNKPIKMSLRPDQRVCIHILEIKKIYATFR